MYSDWSDHSSNHYEVFEMTTPSVLVPDLDKLETALSEWSSYTDTVQQDENYFLVLNAGYEYLATQRMIATAKEGDMSPELTAASHRACHQMLADGAKEETPQAYKDALEDFNRAHFRNTAGKVHPITAVLETDTIETIRKALVPPITNGESE